MFGFCRNCHYQDRHHDGDICRRYPPATWPLIPTHAAPEEGESVSWPTISIWPRVREDDGCGEFLPKAKPS